LYDAPCARGLATTISFLGPVQHIIESSENWYTSANYPSLGRQDAWDY